MKTRLYHRYKMHRISYTVIPIQCLFVHIQYNADRNSINFSFVCAVCVRKKSIMDPRLRPARLLLRTDMARYAAVDFKTVIILAHALRRSTSIKWAACLIAITIRITILTIDDISGAPGEKIVATIGSVSNANGGANRLSGSRSFKLPPCRCSVKLAYASLTPVVHNL